MELTVIGAGAAYPTRAGTSSSCYLVTVGETRLVLDLGQGSFANLAATLEPSTVSAVVISHLHPDHFIDLVPLRHYLRYEFDPPRRVAVYAPNGLARRIDALHDEPGFSAESIDTPPFGPGVRRIGGLRLEARPVTHTAESYAFRVSNPDAGAPGLVYSGDCGRAEDLESLILPGDTLLVEVAFGAAPVPAGAQHLNAGAIARLAEATRPGRVLLTHLQMGYDPDAAVAAVETGFEGPVALVSGGDRYFL